MIRILLALGGVIVVLLAPSVAGASEDNPTLLDLEKKVMCPTCNATLELSHAPIADRIRVFIVERIDAGDTETQIKDKLVAQFGERILAAPRKSGFNLIVWVLPLVAIVAAGAIVFMILRRWFRSRGLAVEAAGEAAVIDPAIQRRIDDELARLD
jgi:cytochrome c-type biogenesis protein CcmH